jgi:hypothetical protein
MIVRVSIFNLNVAQLAESVPGAPITMGLVLHFIKNNGSNRVLLSRKKMIF